MPDTLYMVVERFKIRDAAAVYRRFRDCGRMAPEGLRYVSSWIDEGLELCYQLMETHDRKLLEEWMSRWADLVDFRGAGRHHVTGSRRANRAPAAVRPEPSSGPLTSRPGDAPRLPTPG